eukprot:TRINITY_DN20180_c0_g1_i1.p1 TRINITY_DN20180_c0_g1~~TRINITY_DN20180_c0_g1_i1.p1  ORF type:complete len:258 (-),score=53.84 TRINITY_DN20180_c0_g1_i1:45-818(-)
MFEARVEKASVLKKIIESVKDLVTDANFDCSGTSVSLQAMDSSHVSLVSLMMEADGFESHRCDKRMQLGIKIDSMAKILKCAGNDDVVTLKAEENGNVMSFTFENGTKVSEFELKLLQIDAEVLTIPETSYSAVITMSSAEFQRICRDLTTIGDAVTISATKAGVTFSAKGDLGKGNISLKQSDSMDTGDDAKTTIALEEPVELTFALRYLNFFTKATNLSSTVSLSLAKDVPLVVEYPIENLGYVRYYLAPKIEED